MNSYLAKKQAYYSGVDFANELATLMIPDVHQYVSNIFFCFMQAHESKLIYCDITNQLLKLRKDNGTYYNSFDYKVGTLSVDGRAYANRNFRDWCANMHKISDSFLQIINVVYELQNDVDKVKFGNTVKKCEDLKLKTLWDKYIDLLSVEIKIDNVSKHRLNVGAREKFSPLAFEQIDYFIKYDERDVHISNLLSDENENKIYGIIFELLDYIFSVARLHKYNNRFYVEMAFDPEVPFVNGIELVEDIDTSLLNTIIVNSTNEKQQDGTYICREVSMDINEEPINLLYLAMLYRFPLRNGTYMNKITGFCTENIEVKKNGSIIGYYKMFPKKDVGVHFFKYQFVPANHKQE